MKSPHTSHLAYADLHGWYVDELQPKVGRAVARGRIDPDRAFELNRLMSDLLMPWLYDPPFIRRSHD